MRKIEAYLLIIILNIITAACASKVENGIRPADSDTVMALPESSMTALKSEEDLSVLLDRIGNSRYVLLGEASHGTAEFYT